MSHTAENDVPYRAVLGLFLEHVHIGVSNDFIVVGDVTFSAPAPVRAALVTLMDEWIDGAPKWHLAPPCGHPRCKGYTSCRVEQLGALRREADAPIPPVKTEGGE